ncbi:hypothetical protein RHGRI_030548 [Rhododendron griersonianum]|uniref:GRF-type domain-containing protein n=1 Tax=Rhododendron griersonianum TaxID=479676 RepID=A0AAV6ISJ3_9ERIC|nr:hypothetical protein RHGRI_030548 [Rhododendron griersonianum]
MSTSSTVGTQNYLRYRNRTCKCRERAVVKISESDKNPGRLYYTCKDADNGGCDFWAWCNPTNQINNVSQTRPTSQLLSHGYNHGFIRFRNFASQCDRTTIPTWDCR